MKKFTAILMAMILALFVVSCGGGSNNDNTDTDTTPDDDTTDSDTDPATDDDTTDSDTDPDTDPDTEPDTEPPAEETCKLGSDLYTLEGAERYFAFKGAGVINVTANSEDAQPASLVKIAYDGMKGANFQYGSQLSFFEAGASQFMQNEDVVAVQVYGDVDTTTYRVLTVATVEVPLSYIDFMKENETFELDQAPVAEIAVLKWSKDQAYVQQCIFFGKLVDQQYFSGKTKVCYEKNEEFAPGETFKLSMIAEIGSDEETVEMFSDIESVEDLCPCFLIDDEHPNGEIVDCSTIDEFNTDPTDPTEPTTEPLTCDAAAHKELNEAGDACVCMEGYTENETTHECEAAAPALTCDAAAHKELNAAGDACVCMEGYTENETTHECEAAAPALTCDAAAHKELNAAGNACVCVIGYNDIEGVCRKQCSSNSDCEENVEICDQYEDVCMPA